MHEVIFLSFGHTSNHVGAHLYNIQESHIPYKRDAVLSHDNNVFLSSHRSGSVTYTPRAIIYEHTGGYGPLGKYEYYEPKVEVPKDLQIIQTGERVPKNEYQLALDEGKNMPSALDVLSTRYWSGYSKLLYNPKCMNTLALWEHPEGSNLEDKDGKAPSLGFNRQIPKLLFDTFDKGVESYKDEAESSMEQFRYSLEKCDMIQGLNFVTELDTGWAGFTNSFITDMKDEFFNNGINNKHNIWVHSLLENIASSSLRTNSLLSRIKATVELASNSTLLFPMAIDPNLQVLNQSFDHDSNWHKSNVYAFMINSIWGLNNELQDPVRMSQIQDELLRGYSSRKVVDTLKLHQVSKPNLSPQIQDVSVKDFANIGVLHNMVQDMDITKASILNLSLYSNMEQCSYNDFPGQFLSKSYIVSPNEHSLIERLEEQKGPVNLYKNKYVDEVLNIDTTPKIWNSNSHFLELCIGSSQGGFKSTMKYHRKILMRLRDNEILEDRSELIEQISGLVEEYTTGYESDSDDDYD